MSGKQRKINQDPRTGEFYARVMQHGVSKRFKLGQNQRKARSKLIEIENDIDLDSKKHSRKGLPNENAEDTKYHAHGCRQGDF